jgi:NTE family protein
VLGGGGLAGIAWELGLLHALAEQGLDLAAADLVVGTSAGSVVGTLLRSGSDLGSLYAAQLEAAPAERAVTFDAAAMLTSIGQAIQGAEGPQDARARVGAWAAQASTVPEQERLQIIASRLPTTEWPAARLVVTAVDVDSGELLALDAETGVPLVQAIAASCAVPGVWPPVSLDGPLAGRRCMDGGLRSITNADLARGHDRVLVVTPFGGFPQSPLGPSLGEEVEELREKSEVLVVEADAASSAAFGANPLDPATREPSARAGRAQAAGVLAAVRELWG